LDNIIHPEQFALPWIMPAEVNELCRSILRQDKKNTSKTTETVRCVMPRCGCLAQPLAALDRQQCVQDNTKDMPVESLLQALRQTGIFQ
jgi:hypothetical protein